MIALYRSCAFLSLAAFSLQGCVTHTEMQVRSEGSGLPYAQAVMWQPLPEGVVEEPIQQRAKALLTERLTQRGFRFVQDAPIILSFGLAERSGQMELRTGDDKAVLAAAYQRPSFLSCKRTLHRLTVHFVDAGTGATLYSGRAQEPHCKTPLADAVPYLVEGALVDLPRPVGDHIFARTFEK